MNTYQKFLITVALCVCEYVYTMDLRKAAIDIDMGASSPELSCQESGEYHEDENIDPEQFTDKLIAISDVENLGFRSRADLICWMRQFSPNRLRELADLVKRSDYLAERQARSLILIGIDATLQRQNAALKIAERQRDSIREQYQSLLVRFMAATTALKVASQIRWAVP